jgi:competence protein ComEC
VASLLAGLSAMVSPTVGHLAGRIADVPLWWITWVAEHGARVSGASLTWGTSPGAIALLCMVSAGLVAALAWVLPRRLPSLALSVLMVVALLHPPGRVGWPPAGWVMVMCDVGQGDGLVLNAGAGAAVVVDTGPDPVAMSRCLSDLKIRRVSLVVLTHFHSDHVDGLSAILGHYPVGELEVSPYDEPRDRYRTVTAMAEASDVPVTVAVPGEHRRIGQLRWVVLGPTPATRYGVGDGGSAPNNASVVMLLRVQGVRILLAGDAEPEEENAILRTGADLRVDLLKEPHHGSAGLDPAFLAATHAAVSLISVGADNLYGHPAPEALAWLAELGMAVYRTDRDGDLAVVPGGGGTVSIVTQR